ncbi:aspartate dehydrogenase domain-containing protein isoform X1 [Pleurodeles waltl]|uniref:aspartate dehydrogenase domain-containing protein isoform X1 n=1 Tax=Pleurodeles waltl TaxID=8319 RepID=UPI003709B41D
MSGQRKVRVGIVGYGHLGQYLVDRLLNEGSQSHFELVFVWNRDLKKMDGKVPAQLQLHDLSDFKDRGADLIVEVAHPCITREYGKRFLSTSHFMVGSPTALADPATEQSLRKAVALHQNTLYIPRGALWGGEDIQKMADRGTLTALKVTMTKHPNSFKLEGRLRELNQEVKSKRTLLYEGPVRDLCPLAPNNVNTMAAACMAAHNLGFDGVVGALVADPSLPDWHVVDIEVVGPVDKESGHTFTVKTSRRNPAMPSAVTGTATFSSFWSSLLACTGHGGCVHLC